MAKKRVVKKKRNAGTGTTSYSVHSSKGYKTFGYLKSARAYAQTEANNQGTSVGIYQNGGKGKSWTITPKKANPRKVLPRGKWINAKIRVTKNGTIQAKIKR